MTHWGRATHICVGNLTSISSDNGLSPDRCQAIIWPNAGILLIEPLETNFKDSFIHKNTFKNFVWKMAAILSQFVNMIYNIWSIPDGCNYNVIRGHHGSVSTVSICCRAWWSTDAQHHKHHHLRKRFTLYVLKCFRKHKTVFISFPMTETVQRNEILSDGKHWHIFYIFILMSVINWERQEPGYSRHTFDLTLQECTGFSIEGLKRAIWCMKLVLLWSQHDFITDTWEQCLSGMFYISI